MMTTTQETSFRDREIRSAIMRSNTRSGTSPELKLRRALFARGLRYRVDYPVHVGVHKLIHTDLTFPRHKIAVFVDGCFWHSCPEHGSIPKSNNEYWVPKLIRNQARDLEQTEALESNGWVVVRVWEHEVRLDDNLEAVVDSVEGCLRLA